MPWKYSDDFYREYTRTTWNQVGEAWVGLMQKMTPFRAAVVEGLRPRPGESVLDLGTGPGEPAMTIAAAVGPQGQVVGVDLSERMVEIANRVAKVRGLVNVEFRTMDCTRLEFPDGTFDGCVSAFGFQIFTDPEGAAAEALRVLRPGGRLSVSVWSTGDHVPFLDVLVGPMLARAEPDETGYIPTPYETGGPGELVRFLESRGFRDARERRTTHSLRFGDSDEYLNALLHGTPIGHSLSEESLEVQSAVIAETKANLSHYRGPNGIELPAEVVLVTALK
jgi:ubiquinone/menaquinone biosynthesis C-methylase UbiE